MSEFNQFLQEEKAYLKPFPGAKVKQLCATAVLAQHQYDCAIIHVGINDLLNGSSIEQISKDRPINSQAIRLSLTHSRLFLHSHGNQRRSHANCYTCPFTPKEMK